MNVGGRSMRDHIRMLAPLFGFIAVVWVLRLGLEAAGVSHGIVRIFSLTGATSLAILIAVWRIHTKRFGSYPNVVVVSVLLVVFEQVLIIAAIAFAVMTKTGNVFTRPEYSPPDDPSHVSHILGQLTFGIGAGMLFCAATGSLMLWLLRTLVPVRAGEPGKS